MARTEGLLITCDRCGETVFLKKTGVNDLDGWTNRSTQYSTYQSLPQNWMYETAFGHLCPKCAREFQTFCANFFTKELPSNWKSAIEITEKKE